uniref:DNA-directed RNA polymerase I subunit rpa49 n=1 Tax=Setaria italica TaxID=4555 RepID=K3ZI54_SETIT
MATPDPASASTKKRSKKRKAADGEANSSKTLEPPPEADLQTPATPATASASAKKKHSKKRKATEASTDASTEAAGDASTEAAADASTKAAVDASLNVTVDASLTGGRTAAAPAPAVAYFPTGYDPLAAAAVAAEEDESAPNARLFRHEKHPTWVDLVVGSSGGGPDFVGRSYAGEAATPQLCEYALGVLDKASGTLRVVPIAANKILRLEPHLEVQQPAHSQHSEVASEAGSVAGNDELKVQDLTMMYGTKTDRDKDNKWRSLNEQRNDPSAYEDIDLGTSNVHTNDNQEPVIVRNIPPYDPTADTSEKAYLLDEIIPKNMRQHLLEIVDHFESGQISSKGYSSFVSNRVQKLQELQGQDKERLAWILSYIQHLLSLYERNGCMSKHHRKHRKENKANHGPGTPLAVYRNLLLIFTEPGSSSMSSEKNELLINYILVLTLFADDFRSDPKDICADLKMTRQMLKPYYDQLGCKSVSAGAFKSTFMTLPAPLNFPQDVTRRKRRR